MNYLPLSLFLSSTLPWGLLGVGESYYRGREVVAGACPR